LQAISPARPESKTTRNIAIAVVLICLLLIVGAFGYQAYEPSKPSPTTEGETTTISVSSSFVDESPFIEYGGAWHYSTVFRKGATIHVTVRVEEGGPIDVLLMNSGDFLDFDHFMKGEGGTFQYFEMGSALNVKSVYYQFTIPSDDRYFIVLNNAGRVEGGGAIPVGAVTVYVKIVVSL
jgi:hypothetical protein